MPDCMQADDAQEVLSRKRRILGSSDLLSIVRDLPRKERARLYEARQKTRARADTATARAVETSPSPASRDAAPAASDDGPPEEGELPNPAVPPPAASHVASAPARRVRSNGHNLKADSRPRAIAAAARPGADSGPADAMPLPTQAAPAPPPRCTSATPSAAPEQPSEQPADAADGNEVGEGDDLAETPRATHGTGGAAADQDTAAGVGPDADACTSAGPDSIDRTDVVGACSSSG